MKTTFVSSLVLVPLFLAACGGSANVGVSDDSGSIAPVGDDASAPADDGGSPGAGDAGSPSSDDGSSGDDGSVPAPDGATAPDAESPDDAGGQDATVPDANAPVDAGVPDATLPGSGDSGTDASSPLDAAPPNDASAPQDAGLPVDAANPADAALPIDAALPFDAGPAPDASVPDGGCAVPTGAWTAPSPAAPPLPTEAAPTADTLINVTLPVNDILYDPYTKLLYASVPSSYGANGNSIARIDPTTGTVLGLVYVGSEPGTLAESSDGQFLYVGLNGAAAVRRYALSTQSADIQFALLPSVYENDPLEAVSMRVFPNSPHSVLIVSGSLNYYYYNVIAAYDDGVPRPVVANYETGDSLAFSGSDALAFADYQYGIQTICIDGSGVSVVNTQTPPGSSSYYYNYPSLAYVSGLLYQPTGVAVNISSGTLAGTYATEGPFVVEPSVDRVYFLTSGSSGTSYGAEIIAYDQGHFTPLGTSVFNGVTPDIGVRLVRWGRYGIAFVSSAGAQVSIARTTLIPSQP